MAHPRSPVQRWPLAAFGVAGLVVVILVGGVLLARRATELPTASPVPTLRATDDATRVPTTVQTSVRATAPTSVRSAGALPTETPAAAQPVSASTSVATSTSSFTLALVNGTPQVLPADATVAPEPTPQEWWNQSNSVSPELAAELNAAYTRFWQVRAQALLDLDAGPLATVTDGPELQREVAVLDSMRAQNQGQQIDVQHHMRITHATPTDATLIDDYVARSVPVDLATNETLASTPSSTWHLAYHLRKQSDTWKVVEAVQLTYD